MSSIIACSGCGNRYKATEKLAGKRLRCKCGEIIKVPGPRPAPHVAPAGLIVPEELDLSSASGLLSASGFIPEANSNPCPSCSASMLAGAVLCTACGFNTTTGKKVSGVKDKKAKQPAKQPEPKKEVPAKPAREEDGRPSIAARLVKLCVVLVVVGVLGAGVYYVRAAIRHNPGSEAKDIQTKIYPGMSIADVVKVTERPPREAWIDDVDDKGRPKRVPLHYSETFMKDYPPERLANGFNFAWRFSERAILHVYFTEEGKVHSSQIVNPMAALGM